MAEDMFGDSSLFEEFEKDREPSGSFIFYEKDESGIEDKSRILFQVSSDSSSEDSENEDFKVKVDAVKVKEGVKEETLNTQTFAVNGNQNGVETTSDSSSSEDEEEPQPSMISKERLAKSTTYKLNYELNKFKRFCNIIDSTRFVQDEESSKVQIIFQNNAFSRKHKTQIEGFIKHLIEEDAKYPSETLQKLDLKATAPSCSDLNDKLPVEKRTDRMWQAHSIIGCSHFYRDFVLDTLGWPLVEYNPSLTDSWDVPTYEQVFTDTLPIDEALIKANVKKQEKERNKPKCWNCDGDHMMPDCKEPRNQQKINENRQAMMANKESSGPKPGRYHKDKNMDPKTSAFKPGHISQALREALGLDDKRLPLYIYKMRVLGYPPGWLEEAKSDKVLSMFDTDGNETEEDMATGQLDVKKIIEYPGFSAETPGGIIDECEALGLPPIQPHQLKATLMAQMELQEQMKRKEQEDSSREEQVKKRLKLNTSDMDLDDGEDSDSENSSFAPPLPPDTPPSKPPIPDGTPPITPDESGAKKRASRDPSQTRSESPSLEELEAQYQMLQNSLQDESEVEDGELIVLDSCEDESQSSAVSLDTSVVDDSSQDDDIAGTSKNPITLDETADKAIPGDVVEILDDSQDETEFVKPRLARTGSTTSIKTFGELGSGSPAGSAPGTPLHSPFGDMKPSFKGSVSVSKDYGTPILKRTGSYEALPADNKFAQGIEDHIPFENLPDATGTFNKMRKLIDKIREKVPSRKRKK